jgi:putative tricarboxylic transport membrane protein
VDLCIGNVGELMAQVEGKRARALAVVGEKRLSYLNDVPTLKELGFDIRFTQFRGFWAGPGFPAYAVKYWENAFAKLMEVPEFKEYMVKSGMAPGYMRGEETAKFLSQFNQVLSGALVELKVLK